MIKSRRYMKWLTRCAREPVTPGWPLSALWTLTASRSMKAIETVTSPRSGDTCRDRRHSYTSFTSIVTECPLSAVMAALQCYSQVYSVCMQCPTLYYVYLSIYILFKCIFYTSPLAPRPSPLAPRPSPLAPRPSPLAPRPSPLAPRPSPLAPRPSPLVPRPSSLAPRPPPLVPRHSPLAPRPSPLALRPSPLAPRPSPLPPCTLPPVPRPPLTVSAARPGPSARPIPPRPPLFTPHAGITPQSGQPSRSCTHRRRVASSHEPPTWTAGMMCPTRNSPVLSKIMNSFIRIVLVGNLHPYAPHSISSQPC